VGRRHRQREKLTAPTTDYSDEQGNVLTLRGSLTAAARREYAHTLAGGLEREDAWQRATELLFERLAVAWTVSEIETTRQKELLARYRVATADERRFVREALREHVTENFPELQAP
jgi:predicted transposase YdaD